MISEAIIQTAIEHGIPHAVRTHNVSYQPLYWALKRRGLRARKARDAVDERLAAAYAHATPGFAWSRPMLAEALGITEPAVKEMEERALAKFASALEELLGPEEYAELKHI